MLQRNNKSIKNIEVSLGLLVGYILAATINMLCFDKQWDEAFSDKKLIFSFAGIALSIFLFLWRKRKDK